MGDQKYSVKCQQLLRELKSTVEGLLISQVANVWSIYGGLNRLHNSVEKIFKHGCVADAENVSALCNNNCVRRYITNIWFLSSTAISSVLYIFLCSQLKIKRIMS